MYKDVLSKGPDVLGLCKDVGRVNAPGEDSVDACDVETILHRRYVIYMIGRLDTTPVLSYLTPQGHRVWIGFYYCTHGILLPRVVFTIFTIWVT